MKNDTPICGFSTSKQFPRRIQAWPNLLRRHYRLLSKGTIGEEAGRISRKSQLQKHGQACCISITLLHNIAAETAAWKPRRWVGLNVTKISRVAVKFRTGFQASSSGWPEWPLSEEQSALRCILYYCIRQQAKVAAWLQKHKGKLLACQQCEL